MILHINDNQIFLKSLNINNVVPSTNSYLNKKDFIFNMDKTGKIFTGLTIRVIGAVIGAIGFFLLAYHQTIFGTALIGLGSLIIAVGEG